MHNVCVQSFVCKCVYFCVSLCEYIMLYCIVLYCIVLYVTA